MEHEHGTLYVVATPIGNLGDLTARALETLKAVDLVCAEDTRRTRVLLSGSGIRQKPVTAVNAHATRRVLETVIARLEAGASVALVTDAGTPCISDPGAELVAACRQASIRVVSIPGPSAVTAAASISGLVQGSFSFLGFPPRRGTKRDGFFTRIKDSEEPVILFEAPSRMQETLRDLGRLLPERQACITRELTKLHEEVLSGSLEALSRSETSWRGELTLVIAGRERELARSTEDPSFDPTLRQEIETALRAGARGKLLASELAKRLARPKHELYSLIVGVQNQLALTEVEGKSP